MGTDMRPVRSSVKVSAVIKGCIVAVLSFTIALSAVEAGVVAAKEPIAITKVRAKDPQTKDQFLIAEIVTDMLAQSLENSLTRQLGFFVRVTRLSEPVPEEPAALKAFALDAVHRYNLGHLVTGTLTFSDLGSVLRITTFDRRDPSGGGSVRSGPTEVVVIQRQADFGDIEQKVMDASLRLVQRILQADAQGVVNVFVWCVLADDGEDRALAALSRRLTFEMPYHLVSLQRPGEVSYDFVGISPNEYFIACSRGLPQQRADVPGRLRFEAYEFVVSGEISRVTKETVSVRFLADRRGARRPIPFLNRSIPSAVDDKALRQLALEVLKEFQNIAASR